MSVRCHVIGALMPVLAFMCVPAVIAGQFGTPKEDEGTRIFRATEHPHYSGQFHLSGQKAMLIGSMKDEVPWDHLDYAGKRDFGGGGDRYRRGN